MNNKKGGFGAKLLLVLILMIASAVGGAYGYRVLDGKLAARDALKAVEDVDISDYDAAEQTTIQGYIDEAKKNLETTKTRKEVYEVIGEFIADVAKVQTSNEKKLEEALRAAEEAKQRYNSSPAADQSYSTDSSGTTDNSAVTDNSGATDNAEATDGGYKDDGLTTPDDGQDSGGGFLGSLLGGMSSGSGSN